MEEIIPILKIAAIVIGALCLLSLFFSGSDDERKTTFDADFLDEGEVISRWSKGFCLTGKRCLTIEDSFKNALIIGATGNYKSSGILIPSILRMRGHSSLIINDPSGELLLKTSGAMVSAGYEVKTINYSNPQLSEGFNPLHRITSNSDIKKISKMLIVNALGKASSDPFWNTAAEQLTSLCIQYLINHTAKEYHTLANVYHLVSGMLHAPKKIDALFVHANDPLLLNEYKTYLTYGDKTLSSIIATVRAALAIFATDPSVALVCSHDSLDFSEFRTKKIALYINNSVSDMRYYSVITSLFLDQCFSEIMNKVPEGNVWPIFFLIDEASSLYFSNLNITVSNIRKYQSGILQIYQSLSQLNDLYGAAIARAIVENSNGARVYMGGQPITVCQELETTLGKWEFIDEAGKRNVRSLATANEIHEFEESLIFCGNRRAIKARTVPYFEQMRLSYLAGFAPYNPSHTLPFQTPPLLAI